MKFEQQKTLKTKNLENWNNTLQYLTSILKNKKSWKLKQYLTSIYTLNNSRLIIRNYRSWKEVVKHFWSAEIKEISTQNSISSETTLQEWRGVLLCHSRLRMGWGSSSVTAGAWVADVWVWSLAGRTSTCHEHGQNKIKWLAFA